MKKTIYDLVLHEDIMVDDILQVIRVPGGWIYNLCLPNRNEFVFVPYNEEFISESSMEKYRNFLKEYPPKGHLPKRDLP